jgi:hypothetical protein
MFDSNTVIYFGDQDEPTTFVDASKVTTIVKPSLFVPDVVPVYVRIGDWQSQPLDFIFTATKSANGDPVLQDAALQHAMGVVDQEPGKGAELLGHGAAAHGDVSTEEAASGKEEEAEAVEGDMEEVEEEEETTEDHGRRHGRGQQRRK